MPTNRVIQRTEEGPGFEHDLIPWVADMGPGESLKKLTANETITHGQRAWFKGILLPALSKHSGDSKDWWETRLKTQVMPEEFNCRYVAVGKEVWRIVPSISDLSMTKMNKLIKGSVLHLHDQDMEGQPVEKPIYNGEYDWVTEPDETKRSHP